LSEDQFKAIQLATNQLMEGYSPTHFPIHYLHGGGGTSTNMNINEVLANLGEEAMGGHRGEYHLLRPNDHINLNQSTNDVYPTACHFAVLLLWPDLKKVLDNFSHQLFTLGQTYKDQTRLARTCLQDAIDINYNDYWGGMAEQIRRLTDCLDNAIDRLHVVNLGGTICGRAEDVPSSYLEHIIPNLSSVTGDSRFRISDNLYDSAQNPDDLVSVSARLDILARSLIKIAEDMRFLSSGPQAGLGEIVLPVVQQGSSIMPGKVNPVMPEFVIQIAFRVIGNHAMCVAGLDHGELDLNIWESSIIFPILESMELLIEGIKAFTIKCIQGIHPESRINDLHTNSLMPRISRLVRKYGYQRVSEVCRQANRDIKKLEYLLDQVFGKTE
jgi:aspartate ammonia-lyase